MTQDSISLNAEVFKAGMERLEAAYRTRPVPEASVKLYWEKMKHVPDDLFKRAIEDVIESELFFPSISVLLKITTPKKNPEWF